MDAFLAILKKQNFVLLTKGEELFEAASASFCGLSLLGLQTVKREDLDSEQRSLGDFIIQHAQVTKDSIDTASTANPLTTQPPSTLSKSKNVETYETNCLIRRPQPMLLNEQECEKALKNIANTVQIEYNISSLDFESKRPKFVAMTKKSLEIYKEGDLVVCKDSRLYNDILELYKVFDTFMRKVETLCVLFQFQHGICPFLDCDSDLANMNREEFGEFLKCMESSLVKSKFKGSRQKRGIVKGVVMSALGLDTDSHTENMRDLSDQLKTDFEMVNSNDKALLQQIEDLGARMAEALEAEDSTLATAYRRISQIQAHDMVAEKLMFFRSLSSQTTRSARDNLQQVTSDLEAFLSLTMSGLDNGNVKCLASSCVDLNSIILSAEGHSVSISARQVAITTHEVQRLSCRLMQTNDGIPLVHGLHNKIIVPKGSKYYLRGVKKEVSYECTDTGQNCPVAARKAETSDLIFKNLFLSLRGTEVEIQCINETEIHNKNGYAKCNMSPLVTSTPFLYQGVVIGAHDIHTYLHIPRKFKHLSEGEYFDFGAPVNIPEKPKLKVQKDWVIGDILDHPVFKWAPMPWVIGTGVTVLAVTVCCIGCCCYTRLANCVKCCKAGTNFCCKGCDTVCEKVIASEAARGAATTQPECQPSSNPDLTPSVSNPSVSHPNINNKVNSNENSDIYKHASAPTQERGHGQREERVNVEGARARPFGGEIYDPYGGINKLRSKASELTGQWGSK